MRLFVSRRHVLACFGALAGSLKGLPVSPSFASEITPAIRTTYRFAQIDDRDLDARVDAADLMARVREQIDIVHAVKLPRKMLEAVLRVPVILTSSGPSDSYFNWTIKIDPLSLSKDKPILLHEYLHALHDRVLPDGFNNMQIKQFYIEARSQQKFPLNAYMFKNSAEFFAMTASAVLFGAIQREPFTREQVRLAMPAYFHWLETIFEAKGKWDE